MLALLHKLSFKFGNVSNSLFLASLFHSFCQIVSMYITILGFRSDQQICERAVTLDVKAAFASPSAFSFSEMPTCEGIMPIPPGLSLAIF